MCIEYKICPELNYIFYATNFDIRINFYMSEHKKVIKKTKQARRPVSSAMFYATNFYITINAYMPEHTNMRKKAKQPSKTTKQYRPHHKLVFDCARIPSQVAGASL
ncbi:hypothetical protein PanWU01x14_094230 [Parasponia andersonii]|uniref:Uncharacterized protein n=1 Tax=Parasponia andersonii TaxID=3476 RepID=A0A2P5D5N3_PARAD|nr:hypothetical protein PanWU01x14_094230 [Parasponia andersonii]